MSLFFSKNSFGKKCFFGNFFSRNFLLLSRPLHSVKVICTEKLSEKIQNGQKWPFQTFSDNFPQKDWYKFGMVKNGHFNFFSDNFSQKDWYKFRMVKNDHSKFFPTIFPKKPGINSEWPKMAIPNFFQQFFQKRLV